MGLIEIYGPNDDTLRMGLIRIYGPNDDALRVGLLEELEKFISMWDVPWCLGGDFNVVRFSSERSTRGRLSSVMCELLAFSNLCNLVEPPLEGARFAWSSHEEVPILSHIDHLFFSV